MFCGQDRHALGVGGGGEDSALAPSAQQKRWVLETARKCSCPICVADHSLVIFQLCGVQSWAAVPREVEWSGRLCRRVPWGRPQSPQWEVTSGLRRDKGPASLTTCCQGLGVGLSVLPPRRISFSLPGLFHLVPLPSPPPSRLFAELPFRPPPPLSPSALLQELFVGVALAASSFPLDSPAPLLPGSTPGSCCLHPSPSFLQE